MSTAHVWTYVPNPAGHPCVCVWLDETSDGDGSWIVSIDEYDYTRCWKPLNSRTIGVFADRPEAVVFARAEGERLQMPVRVE